MKLWWYYYYSVVCLTTGPTPLPKRFLHIVRSRASSLKWEYPLLSLRSSSSFLRLLPRLLVIPSLHFFPSLTCFRRQFLRKMWPIQLAFRFRISHRIFLCSVLFNHIFPWYVPLFMPTFSYNGFVVTIILLTFPSVFYCTLHLLTFWMSSATPMKSTVWVGLFFSFG